MSLKDNGFSKPKKKFSSYIICSECKKKIYIDREDEQENITKVGHTRVYECYCGNEIILD